MAIIESIAVAASRRRVLTKDARELADDALDECLSRAHLRAVDIDLLVNTGIYRSKNLAEPALASMIQEDIGANVARATDDRGHGTFSFDVANGACGVLTALQIVDGLMSSRVVEVGAVVASDSNPGDAEGFPFPSIGGAILLRPGPPGRGFAGFHFETFADYATSMESVIRWHEREHPLPFLPDGRNALEVEISDRFASLSVHCAKTAVGRYLASREISPRDVDLLVASADSPKFAPALAGEIGIAAESVVAPEERFTGAHSAGLVVALDAALRSGWLAEAKNVLLVTAGAGITVGTALYRHTPA